MSNTKRQWLVVYLYVYNLDPNPTAGSFLIQTDGPVEPPEVVAAVRGLVGMPDAAVKVYEVADCMSAWFVAQGESEAVEMLVHDTPHSIIPIGELTAPAGEAPQ